MVVMLRAVPKRKQRTIIQFLTLENVSRCQIHVRMCVVYGVQNVITKSVANPWVQIFKGVRVTKRYCFRRRYGTVYRVKIETFDRTTLLF